jgi:hypothetical protein
MIIVLGVYKKVETRRFMEVRTSERYQTQGLMLTRQMKPRRFMGRLKNATTYLIKLANMEKKVIKTISTMLIWIQMTR